MTLIAIGLAFLRLTYIHFTHIETGQNVKHVDWLPAAASNVSYYQSHNFTSYEFDISEAEFRKWAWWDVKPIDKTVSIRRYNYFSIPDDRRNAIVSDGLAYCSKQRTNGGGYYVVYDRERRRAFFHSASR